VTAVNDALLADIVALLGRLTKDLDRLHSAAAAHQERLDVHGLWLERLNRDNRHLMRYSHLPTEEKTDETA
jgi:hypothetical protein